MKSNRFVLPILILAAITVYVVGNYGYNNVKLAGVVLAAIAFLPVFVMLKNTMGKDEESAMRLMGVFVGGFFFKLAVVLLGIWWGISHMKWHTIDFVVSCVAFLFAMQIFESLYFWSKRSE